MSKEEIFNKIKDLIAENFDVDKDKITESTSFTDDLDADSIDLVEFILQLEDEYSWGCSLIYRVSSRLIS